MKGRSLSGYQRKRVWLNDGRGPLHGRRAGRRRDRHLRRPGGRARRSRQPRRARRHRRQPARAAADLQEHGRPGRHWIQFELEGARQQPQRDRRARRAAAGTAACRCRRSAAAAASARRTSGACTTAWATRRRSIASIDPVAVGPAQTIERPPVDTLHHIKEPDGSDAATDAPALPDSACGRGRAPAR